MPFMPDQAVSMLAWAFIGLLCFILFLNVFGLPANWIIIGLVGLWQWMIPASCRAGFIFWFLLAGLALLGEFLELAVQVLKAKKYGSSSSGTFMGMIGAILGAIFLAPLFWGIGAFIGALAGAWLGCFLMELLKGRNFDDALHSAFGTLLGRFLGTVCKTGAGAAMIAIVARRILPEGSSNPDDLVIALIGWSMNNAI